jgi:hypothetical protein
VFVCRLYTNGQTNEKRIISFAHAWTWCPINKDLVANESFLKSESTLRHLNSIKYKATWMCCQSLLNLNENTPKSPQAVLSRIEIYVSKETYFTDFNAYGEFQTKNEKNTLKLTKTFLLYKIFKLFALIKFHFKKSEFYKTTKNLVINFKSE